MHAFVYHSFNILLCNDIISFHVMTHTIFYISQLVKRSLSWVYTDYLFLFYFLLFFYTSFFIFTMIIFNFVYRIKFYTLRDTSALLTARLGKQTRFIDIYKIQGHN